MESISCYREGNQIFSLIEGKCINSADIGGEVTNLESMAKKSSGILSDKHRKCLAKMVNVENVS